MLHRTLRRSLNSAQIAGSRTLLSRLAVNLIDNAIRYNQTGASTSGRARKAGCG
jgi:signal transduction histidine kinase